MIGWSSCVVARPIPIEERRRVWVEGAGHGYEQARHTLGSLVTRVEVLLDTGEVRLVAPSRVHEAGPIDLSNVVLLRVTNRALERSL